MQIWRKTNFIGIFYHDFLITRHWAYFMGRPVDTLAQQVLCRYDY